MPCSILCQLHCSYSDSSSSSQCHSGDRPPLAAVLRSALHWNRGRGRVLPGVAPPITEGQPDAAPGSGHTEVRLSRHRCQWIHKKMSNQTKNIEPNKDWCCCYGLTQLVDMFVKLILCINHNVPALLYIASTHISPSLCLKLLTPYSLLSIPVTVCLPLNTPVSSAHISSWAGRTHTCTQKQISLLTLAAAGRSGSCGSGTMRTVRSPDRCLESSERLLQCRFLPQYCAALIYVQQIDIFKRRLKTHLFSLVFL